MEGRITAMQAYCARCGGKRSVSGFIVSTTRTGRQVMWGRCEVCGGAVTCSVPEPPPQPEKARGERWGLKLRRAFFNLFKKTGSERKR